MVGKDRLTPFLHGPRRIFVGQRRRTRVKFGIGLQRQVIKRNVFGGQRTQRAQIVFRLGRRLLGQGVHQVEVDVVEPGGPRPSQGLSRFIGPVNAAEGFQVSGIEALHADGQAVDAGLSIPGKIFRVGGAGIGLERDFNIGGEAQPLAHTIEHARDRRAGEQTGRAAAHKDGDQRP